MKPALDDRVILERAHRLHAAFKRSLELLDLCWTNGKRDPSKIEERKAYHQALREIEDAKYALLNYLEWDHE